MQFFIKAMGVKHAVYKTERLGAAAIDAKPAFATMLELIFGIEEAMFDSEGRRGGGSWKQLTRDWYLRKLTQGLDPRINHATLALRKSMTLPGADGQRVAITQGSLLLASNLPQAGPSQKFRPFVRFTVRDREEMGMVISHHLKHAWGASG